MYDVSCATVRARGAMEIASLPYLDLMGEKVDLPLLRRRVGADSTRTRARTHARTRAHTPTHAHARTHTHTHTRTHTHRRACARTRAHYMYTI